METLLNYIDTSFDNTLEKSNIYTWLPWVGKSFLATNVKTLILGESTYNWEEEDSKRENIYTKINKSDHLRIVHKNNAIDFKGKSLYARNIERAILLKSKASKSEAEKIWTNVIYHNLVLRAMNTVKHRPKYNDYLEGWFCFINLVKTIPISQCIVYGLEASKIKSFKEVLKTSGIGFEYIIIKPEIGKSSPKVMIIHISGNEIKMLFIHHPSSYFSWTKWGAVLNAELDIKNLY